MTRYDRLKLMAAQIFAGAMPQLAANTPEGHIKAVAEAAVKAAKAMSEAVERSPV